VKYQLYSKIPDRPDLNCMKSLEKRVAKAPGRIIASIPVPLARPRVRGSTLSPDFLVIKERCLELLHLDPTASEPVNEAA